MSTDWSHAVWDSIPAFLLTKELVNSFLQECFGYYDFYTRLSTDHFQFWIPRKLTQDERVRLLEKRVHEDPRFETPQSSAEATTRLKDNSTISNERTTSPNHDQSYSESIPLSSPSPPGPVHHLQQLRDLEIPQLSQKKSASKSLLDQNLPIDVHATDDSQDTWQTVPSVRPEWSVGDVLDWKAKKKGMNQRIPMLRPELRDRLRDREHIFLVDDSSSMAKYWPAVIEVIEAMSYVLKDVATNGLDLSFTISREALTKVKKTTRLVKMVTEHFGSLKGETNMELKLAEILKECQTRFERPRMILKTVHLPLSLYILTDGNWQKDCDPQRPIMSLITKLVQFPRLRSLVAIHFISFGNNLEALERLDYLTLGLDLELDIMDLEPAHGDVWKMLLGCINEFYDSSHGNIDSGVKGRPPTRESASSTRIGKYSESFSGNFLIPPPHPSPEESEPPNGSAPSLDSDQRFMNEPSPPPIPGDSSNPIKTSNPSKSSTRSVKSLNSHLAVNDQPTRSPLPFSPPRSATDGTGDQESSIEEDLKVPESTKPTTVSQKPDRHEDTFDDAMTIRTDNRSLNLPTDEKEQLVRAVATKIWNSTTAGLSHRVGATERIATALPDLLKELSQDLWATALPGIEQDSLTFLRHYRRHISTSFESSAAMDDDQSETKSRRQSRASEQLTLVEKLNRWNIVVPESFENEILPLEPTDDPSISEKQSSEEFDGNYSVPNLPQGWVFVFESGAFDNLQSRIRSALLLTPRKGLAIDSIRETIFKGMVIQSRQTKKTPPLNTLFISLSWSPVTFLQSQYGDGFKPKLKDVITFTGTAFDAQAATCGDYTDQLWQASGLELLEAVQSVINLPQAPHKCQLSNGSTVQIQLFSTYLAVSAQGSIMALADLGEQLAWLGAACQVSNDDDTIQYLVPELLADKSSISSFAIQYRRKEFLSEERTETGTCWHHLLKNPVIASGFPILARNYGEKGLEIPLNMMATLGGANKVTVFGHQLLIKGFSTMFVPTAQTPDSILWHFLFQKSEEERMTYLTAKTGCPAALTIDVVNYTSLTMRRTFLGWASSTLLCTGSQFVDYTALKLTGANVSRPGCALEKVTISAGKYITAEATIAPGKKDTRLTLSSSGPYRRKIYAASRMNVIFYDTTDRRAWLIDGANALLHLTRAQLCQKEFEDSHMDLDSFPHSDPTQGPDAALNALHEIGQRNPVLIHDTFNFGESPTTETKYGVKDLVLDNWHILEQIQDRQTELSGPGKPIQSTDRDKLEGFGFVDIISGETSIRPRLTILEASGRVWVDFTREIQAITLMARGFGELIKPTGKGNHLCRAWLEVPKDKDYLVARVHQLHRICELFGDKESKPLELVQGLFWHQAGALFESCLTNQCQPGCDRVQVLLRKHTLGSRTPKKLPVPFEGDMSGAVIFGRNSHISRWWPRNPDVEPLSDEAACRAEDARQASIQLSKGSFHDSGLATAETTNSEDTRASSRSRTGRPVTDSTGLSSTGQPFSSNAAGPSVYDEFMSRPNGKAGLDDRHEQGNGKEDLTSGTAIVNDSGKIWKGKEPVRPPGYMNNNALLNSKEPDPEMLARKNSSTSKGLGVNVDAVSVEVPEKKFFRANPRNIWRVNRHSRTSVVAAVESETSTQTPNPLGTPAKPLWRIMSSVRKKKPAA